MRKVLIIDTSILCVYLEVPGKETCGSGNNRWNKQRVVEILETEEKASTTFVLPLAAIIETGCQVEILTGDDGLKAYQPTTPAPTPRRRRSR